MTRAPSICSTPGCGMEATRGAKCADCARSRRERGPYASKEWKRVRAAYLRKHPDCEAPGCRKKATDVHHVDEDNTNHAEDNLEARCHGCHSRVSGFMRFASREPIRDRDVNGRGLPNPGALRGEAIAYAPLLGKHKLRG